VRGTGSIGFLDAHEKAGARQHVMRCACKGWETPAVRYLNVIKINNPVIGLQNKRNDDVIFRKGIEAEIL